MPALRRDRRSLAVQLRDQIWDTIQQDHYRPGDRLPSEQELGDEFGVSRATVREALKILEEERVLICQHGVGRFLAPNPAGAFSDEVTHLKSVTDMAHGLGISLSTHVLSVHEHVADNVVRARLDLDPDSQVVTLERVRLADGEPFIYSIDIFPSRLVAGALRADLFAGSLLSVMEGQWGAYLAYSKALISAVLLDAEVGERIGVPDCIPWILMEQVNYDDQHRPVLYSKDYHRGDKFQFRVLRRRR